MFHLRFALWCYLPYSLFAAGVDCSEKTLTAASELHSLGPQIALLFPWSQGVIEGGNGTSLKDSVRIEGVSTIQVYTDMRNYWISAHYPNAVFRETTEIAADERYLERIRLVESNQSITLFFDITPLRGLPFLGKWAFISTEGTELSGFLDRPFQPSPNVDQWRQEVGKLSGYMRFQYEYDIGMGQIAHGSIVLGERNGNWWFCERKGRTGNVQYHLGKFDGRDISWYESGMKWMERMWTNAVQCGWLKEWDERGKIIREHNFGLQDHLLINAKSSGEVQASGFLTNSCSP